MRYLSVDEKKDNKNYVQQKLTKKNEFIELGIFQDVMNKYVAKDLKILEIGCSVGETAQVLREMGYKNLYLTDIDDYLLPELKNNFFLADLNKDKMPLENESVGTVIALNVFEHVENPFYCARECARVLPIGGHLIISIPYGHNIFDKIYFLFSGNIPSFHPNNDHTSFFLKDIFNKVFKNFKIVETRNGYSWVPYLYPTRLNKKFRKRLEKKMPRWDCFNYHKMYILQKISN